MTAPAYNFFRLAREALRGHVGWLRAWRRAEPKRRYDAVIVGGGGHGLATAAHLARDHGMCSVAVLEKGWIGGGNTGRNTTIIRSNYRLPENRAFYEHALKMWEGLTADLDFNLMVSQRGVLFLGHSEAEMDRLAERGDGMRHDGIDAELLNRTQVSRLVPLLDCSALARFPIRGGLFQRRAGTVRHDAVAWGYARKASSLGVDIIENCEVTGFDIANGRVHGVRTSRGDIGAGVVGVAVAGMTSAVLRQAGVAAPIESHLLQAFVTEPIKPMIDTVVLSGAVHCYVSQTDKGEVVIGGDLDFYPSYSQRGALFRIEEVAGQAIAMFPALSRLRMQRCWAGIMDMTLDGSPIIGPTPVNGLHVNGGWCYGGFKATPASGQMFAELIASGRSPPLIAPFALDRFARGALLDEAGVGPIPHLH